MSFMSHPWQRQPWLQVPGGSSSVHPQAPKSWFTAVKFPDLLPLAEWQYFMSSISLVRIPCIRTSGICKAECSPLWRWQGAGQRCSGGVRYFLCDFLTLKYPRTYLSTPSTILKREGKIPWGVSALQRGRRLSSTLLKVVFKKSRITE